ncbi:MULTISPECIES: MFS transporter [unclassified Streptomyces]|uniref:MFS transporter n=1 Tax=unclassified Streptomyces TaxID=2593676 RepID=UPI002E197CB1|nr:MULTISPECIES: MFS transporter [unclassified Streptomyces]
MTNDEPLAAAMSSATPAGPPDAPHDAPQGELPPVGRRFIWLLLLANFGAFLGLVTPMAISLAIRVEHLAPDNTGVLGYVVGTASAVSVIAGPLFGTASDRTRSRFGRRRPWIAIGAVVGLLGSLVLTGAQSVFLLGVGWVIAALGWTLVMNLITTVLADRLPESQRGRISGISGFISMAAPVAGSILGGALAGNTFLLFAVPATIGLLLALAFVLLVHEDPTNDLQPPPKLDLKSLASTFVFDPRRYPDFAWNWLARFLFYMGLTFNTTFTALFFADRLGKKVAEISQIVAVTGGLTLVAVSIGAISSGFVSDKVGRRKPFVLLGGIIFAGGATLMAFVDALPLLLTGAFVASLGMGLFSAVDQAILLDIVPERSTDAGRFIAINQFATSIAQAVAPIAAPTLLTVGVVRGGENYTLLYLVAAAFTLAAGTVVITRVRSIR